MPQQRISKKRSFFARTQIIDLEPIDCSGLILDIGAGGEGIISLLQKNVVIAIGIQDSESGESSSGAVRVVMDVADMQFHEATFDMAVAFFSLKHVPPEKLERVFRECHRVLQPMGRFLIWDIMVPRRTDPARDVFVVPLRIRTPDTVIQTSYAVPWDTCCHNMDDYVHLADDSGFEILSKRKENQTFHLTLRKMT